MAAKKGWSKERYEHARATLRRHTTVQDAARELSISTRALREAFAKIGDSAASYVRSVDRDLDVAREKQAQRDHAATIRDLQRKLIDYQKAENFFASLRTLPEIKINRSRPKSGKRPATPITLASDWHIGEVVTAEETLGRNEYNLKIARQRAGNYWDNILWLRRDGARHQTFDDHVLVLGGDMVTGSIHPELAETNEVPLNDQVSEAHSMILPGIEALAAECRRLIVVAVAGNHGRITDKSRIKTGWANNLEVLLYRWLRDSTKAENVEWYIPRAEGFALDVHGYRVQAQHGTQIKSQGGIGGILVPLTRYATRAASAHLYLFGHFHTACAFESVIVNGSLIGDSAYSKWHGMTYRPPEQVTFVIDERHGVRHFERVSVT